MAGVFGALELFGLPHNVYHTKLASTAEAGSDTLELSQPVDWQVRVFPSLSLSLRWWCDAEDSWDALYEIFIHFKGIRWSLENQSNTGMGFFLNFLFCIFHKQIILWHREEKIYIFIYNKIKSAPIQIHPYPHTHPPNIPTHPLPHVYTSTLQE